ncbi:hypothetical protein [Haladaptatus salinisoli]|uniref:hypothetical protein n=1 Tax=Haladaptatus salinisoli TaxID=2884876 RepID=UPI001D09B4C1|nr:hypothetical protein [Haladaptatus salinisoli]
MTSNRRPIYIGTDPEDAVCDRHGAMERRAPIVTFDGHVHALADAVSVYNCPECCLELARESGGPTETEQAAFEACWRQLVDTRWRSGLRRLFVDLGRGGVDDGTIHVRERLDDDEIPDYLREADDWEVKTLGDAGSE